MGQLSVISYVSAPGESLSVFIVSVTALTYNTLLKAHSIDYDASACKLTPAGYVSCSIFVPVEVPNYIPLNVTEVLAIFGGSPDRINQGAPVIGFAGKWVIPQVLAQAYNVPPGTVGSNSNSSQAVAEFLGEYYASADLAKFFQLMSLPNTTVAKVVGPNDETHPGGEATLDIEYLMALSVNISTEFWSTPGGSAEGEPYADWLAQLAATEHIPWVHSISYGDIEAQWNEDDAKFVCNQLQYAGLRGVSMLFSSGDDGVANFEARQNTSFCKPFTPAFPATCPYVTVVGGTQFSTFTSPICEQSYNNMRLSCDAVGEVAADSATGAVITTGGGFSNLFSRPDYQNRAVNSFMTLAQASNKLPPPEYFNTNGRGYPDVSAMAHNFLIVMNGEISPIRT